MRLHKLQFDGEVLRRGFWLYVWEIITPSGPCLHYVGRTGDSSSTNAQSPFNRMSQHLGFNKRSNVLRKYLTMREVLSEECQFRLVSLGPIEEESNDTDRAEHDRRRDAVAAMESALALAMKEAGYFVMNDITSRKNLDMERFRDVVRQFACAFPLLLRYEKVGEEASDGL